MVIVRFFLTNRNMGLSVAIIYGLIVLVLSSYVVYLNNRITKINFKIKLAMWKVRIGRDDFYSDLVDIEDMTD